MSYTPYFLTFPFRVSLEKITSPGDFVFRYYDGAERAQNGKGGWKNVEGSYLEPGCGYIFQTNADGTLTFEVEKSDMDFSGNERKDGFSVYATDNMANASWNFLGNPHTAYFDISATEYTAPLTIWNGSGYQAVRPGDDQYFLQPFQAFFVQKPEGTDAMTFPADGRYTYKQTQEKVAANAAARILAPAHTTRHLLNLSIADAEGTVLDQTRVVYNDAKSTAYELDCDAAKFFSDSQATQLYTLDGQGTQYAINERPVGEVPLAFTAKEEGTLTIAATRMDMPVLLHDNVMNITHDLTMGGYTFQTEVGTCESRFMLTVDGSVTAIEETAVKTAKGTAYGLDGIQRISDSRGIQIVKEDNTTKKIIR